MSAINRKTRIHNNSYLNADGWGTDRIDRKIRVHDDFYDDQDTIR
jgi:hypothetical protein